MRGAWGQPTDAGQQGGSAGRRVVNTKSLSEFEIPLPPLEVQKDIVAEIEGYQKVIDGARAVLDNYPPTSPSTLIGRGG